MGRAMGEGRFRLLTEKDLLAVERAMERRRTLHLVREGEGRRESLRVLPAGSTVWEVPMLVRLTVETDTIQSVQLFPSVAALRRMTGR